MKTLHIERKGVTHSVLLDDDDYDYVASNGWWSICQSPSTPTLFYARGELDGRKQAMHRVIYARHYPFEETQRLDHIDGNGLNNQKANLRIATTKQNGQNRRKHKVATSQYKGVSLDYKGQWRAAIKADGHTRVIKSALPTERMAAIAYDIEARQLFGEFAAFNIPDASPEEIEKVQDYVSAWTYRGKTSRYRGVCFVRKTGRWQVSFWHEGKPKYFGQHDDETEAARVYNQRASELLGSKAKLNVL